MKRNRISLSWGPGVNGPYADLVGGGVARKVIRKMPCSIVAVKTVHAIQLRLDDEVADL